MDKDISHRFADALREELKEGRTAAPTIELRLDAAGQLRRSAAQVQEAIGKVDEAARKAQEALEPLAALIAASRGGAETVMMSRQVWDVLLGKVQDEQRDLLKSPAKPRVADVLLAVLVAAIHVRRAR